MNTEPCRRCSPLPFLIAGLLLLGGANPVSSTEPVTLSFDNKRSRVFLPVNAGVTGPYRFLLDTGYDLTMIHPDLAEKLNLQRAGRIDIIGIAGHERGTMYRGARFDFEGKTFAPRRVAALPSERNRRHRRDGILGSSFFKRFVIEINAKSGEVRLHEPEGFEYEGNGQILPITYDSETPVINVQIDRDKEKPLTASFEIDTGCDSAFCLDGDFLEKHDWLKPSHNAKQNYRQGVGGSTRTAQERLPNVRLGKFTVNTPEANFFERSISTEGLAGHIGFDLLRNYRVFFDYNRDRIILQAF